MPSLPASYDEPATAEEAVMVTLARLGRRMRQRMPGEELDFGTILLMKALLRGPLRLTDLAAAVELDASTVSRQVRQLEDRGLVERTGDPDDGRASRVAVSDLGRTLLEEGAARSRATVSGLLASWDDAEREQLRVLLARLYADLSTSPAPGTAPAPTTHVNTLETS